MTTARIDRDAVMNIDIHSELLDLDTLFIHGNLASNTWWEPSLEVWQSLKSLKGPRPQGRAVLGEWRGCGKSKPPNSADELHPSWLADDYISALRALGIKKTSVVGHSTGGLIALYAMMKAPDLFDRAVLLDPVSATGIQFDDSMYDAFTKMSQDRSFCEAVMGGTIHGNDSKSPRFQKIVDEAQIATQNLGHDVLNALKNVDITNDLASVRQPILVLHGEHDAVLPIEGSIALAKNLPNATFVKIANHGHSMNMENPEAFVKTVNEFLFSRS